MTEIESESGIALLSRLGSRPSLKNLDKHIFQDGLQSSDVVEILGPSGCGKTMLLLHIMASSLLPKKWNGIYIDGCNAGVIFVDVDLHFNILQLSNIMELKVRRCIRSAKNHIPKQSGEILEVVCDKIKFNEQILSLSKSELKQNVSSLVKECLKDLFYLRCVDSNQFSVSLLSLDQVIISNANISLIIIDSLSGYYWYDKTYRGDKWNKVERYYLKIISVLIRHIKRYKISLICTKQDLFKKKVGRIQVNDAFSGEFDEAEENQNSYEYLGKEWSKNVDIKINFKTANAGEINSLSKCSDACHIEVCAKSKSFSFQYLIHEYGFEFML